MQLELFFSSYDFYGTQHNLHPNNYITANEDIMESPFDKTGFLYYSDCNSSDWIELH